MLFVTMDERTWLMMRLKYKRSGGMPLRRREEKVRWNFNRVQERINEKVEGVYAGN